jgi:DNA-binding PadR family transcriptional regulator
LPTQRSIGETKLKILAIIHHNGTAHGYDIWTTLRARFHCYLNPHSRRNVYHHLHDLEKLGLIQHEERHAIENAPKNHPYILTEKGKKLEQVNKFLEILHKP